MFICSFICNDFDNGILKNIISRGYSRQSIFTAKFMAVIVSTLFMVILNLVAVFAVSSALYHNIGSIYALFIPQLIILVFGLISFAGIFFMLCSIFKKERSCNSCFVACSFGFANRNIDNQLILTY